MKWRRVKEAGWRITAVVWTVAAADMANAAIRYDDLSAELRAAMVMVALALIVAAVVVATPPPGDTDT